MASDLEKKNCENTSMMCHLDKTSCSHYNTAAHFGVDAGSVAAAAAGDEKKMSRGMFGRVAVKNMKSIAKYHHHVYVIHRLGSYVYKNSDVADRGLPSFFPASSPPCPALPFSPMG